MGFVIMMLTWNDNEAKFEMFFSHEVDEENIQRMNDVGEHGHLQTNRHTSCFLMSCRVMAHTAGQMGAGMFFLHKSELSGSQIGVHTYICYRS